MLEAEHALRIQGACRCPVRTYLKASFELLYM